MIFWVEVSQKIGMGHFKEAIFLSDHFNNPSVHFIIPPYLPAELELKKKKISYSIMDINNYENIIHLIKKISKKKCIIINHRNVSLKALETLRRENCLVAVIDQLGGKQIICDLLINKSIVSEWLKYDFVKDKPVCCFGADYAILEDCYEELHKREKKFTKTNYTILVSMGGVDRTGSTLRIIKALQSIDNTSKEIIIGNGFSHIDKLHNLRKKLNDSSFIFSQGVDDLGKRMSKADIVISAGGNTVYEMACVGTPGIVLWEDEHEYIQGKIFSERRTLLCLGNGIKTPIELISNSIKVLLKDVNQRKNMSQCGKKLVDFHGKKRIVDELYELIKRNFDSD